MPGVVGVGPDGAWGAGADAFAPGPDAEAAGADGLFVDSVPPDAPDDAGAAAPELEVDGADGPWDRFNSDWLTLDPHAAAVTASSDSAAALLAAAAR